MAWSNRWGWPFANDKQRLLDQVDEQLADLKVAPEERVEITRPYTQLIGVDLFSIFHSVMERYTQWKEGELRSNLNGSSSPPAAFQQFTNDVQEWRSRSWPGPVGKLQSYDLEAELEIATPSKILDDDQTRRVQAFKDEILRMYKECKAKGGYTKETADFVDKYGHEPLGGADRKMAEVFGVAFEKH